MWQMLCGSGSTQQHKGDDFKGISLLAEEFTVRGLENFTTKEQSSKALDPKRNVYIQTVLREQEKNSYVDPSVVCRLTGEYTGKSLKKAQQLAKKDARDAQEMLNSPWRSSSRVAKRQSLSPPISPASVVAFDTIHMSRKEHLRRQLHTQMAQYNPSAHDQARRCSMEMYQQREQHFNRHHQHHPVQPREMYEQSRRSSLPVFPQQPNSAHHPHHVPGFHHPKDHSYVPYHDSVMTNSRGTSHQYDDHNCDIPHLPSAYFETASDPQGRTCGNGTHPTSPPRCLTLSPRSRKSPVRHHHPAAFQGEYYTMYPRYERYVGELSGMRRDSLAGHYPSSYT